MYKIAYLGGILYHFNILLWSAWVIICMLLMISAVNKLLLSFDDVNTQGCWSVIWQGSLICSLLVSSVFWWIFQTAVIKFDFSSHEYIIEEWQYFLGSLVKLEYGENFQMKGKRSNINYKTSPSLGLVMRLHVYNSSALICAPIFMKFLTEAH